VIQDAELEAVIVDGVGPGDRVAALRVRLRRRLGRAVDQLLTGRPEVRAARRGRVIAAARRRRAWVEVSRVGETLPEQSRPDDPAGRVGDERAVGLVVK